MNTISQMKKTDRAASYSGGFDFDAGEPSESADAFEVIWFPAAASEVDNGSLKRCELIPRSIGCDNGLGIGTTMPCGARWTAPRFRYRGLVW